jgi:ethanolamine utilization microcompartment shell protein EutL
VQTNTQTIPVSGIANIAITSVNTASTFVLCQNDTQAGLADSRALCELTSATNLRITIFNAAGTEVVQWHVVEFYSGVTVQRSPVGGTLLAAGGPSPQTVNVPLAAAVNLAQTFVLISENMSSNSANIDEQWTVRAQLTSTTNLQLTRNATATAINVAWQVVQIASSAVQSGTATIAVTATTVTAALNPPVDLARTFLVFSRSGGSSSSGVEVLYQTTGEITNATTLTFTRAIGFNFPNLQVDIAWFAVRMTDGTTVQRGLQGPSGIGGASATMNAPLATAVVINRSVPFISVRGDPATGSFQTDLDDTSWRAALNTTTNLRLTRASGAPGNNITNATVAWQVVQFNNQPNLVDGDGREIFP